MWENEGYFRMQRKRGGRKEERREKARGRLIKGKGNEAAAITLRISKARDSHTTIRVKKQLWLVKVYERTPPLQVNLLYYSSSSSSFSSFSTSFSSSLPSSSSFLFSFSLSSLSSFSHAFFFSSRLLVTIVVVVVVHAIPLPPHSYPSPLSPVYACEK